MSLIFVDVSATSMAWFRGALIELSDNVNVKFLFSDIKKYKEELEKAPKLANLLKLMKQVGRRVDADKDRSEHHAVYLTGLAEWKSEAACDDEHIFAMIYEKPTKFIFSSDVRIAKCRGCINKVVDKRYCGFIVISDEVVFNAKKPEILKK